MNKLFTTLITIVLFSFAAMADESRTAYFAESQIRSLSLPSCLNSKGTDCAVESRDPHEVFAAELESTSNPVKVPAKQKPTQEIKKSR